MRISQRRYSKFIFEEPKPNWYTEIYTTIACFLMMSYFLTGSIREKAYANALSFISVLVLCFVKIVFTPRAMIEITPTELIITHHFFISNSVETYSLAEIGLLDCYSEGYGKDNKVHIINSINGEKQVLLSVRNSSSLEYVYLR